MSYLDINTLSDFSSKVINSKPYNEDKKKSTNSVDSSDILSPTNQPVEKKIKQVAEDFVSIFMTQMMKSMRSTVDENKMFHGGNGEKFFSEMLDQEYSKSAAKGSGYGLTDLVYQSLLSKSNISGSDFNLQEITNKMKV